MLLETKDSFFIKATEADAMDAGNVLRVSTKYMETIQPVVPVTGGTDISAYLNTDGGLDLYTVGTAKSVFRLHPQPGNYGPYDAKDLGIKAEQLFPYAPSTAEQNRPNNFGVDADGKLSLSTYDSGLDKYSQKVDQPTGAVRKIREFLAVKGAKNVYVNVVLEDGTLGSSFRDPAGKWASSDWVPVQNEQGQDIKALSMTMCANSPVQAALFCIDQQNEVLFSEDNFRFTQMRKLNKKAVHLAVVADSEDLLNIFAVDLVGDLYVKKQKKYSTTEQMQFEDWKPVASGAKLSRVYAGLRFDKLIEVFAIGGNGRLYRTYQTVDAKKKPVGWAQLFPLGNAIDASIFTVVRDKNGYSQAFTVSHDSVITRFWQSEETTQWMSEAIAYGEVTASAKVATHSVEFIVYDEQGVAQSDSPVTLSASYPVSLSINGRSYRCSPVDEVVVNTGAGGKLVVYQQAVALAGATLFVETKFSGGTLEVEPNGELQARLHAMTGPQVLEAKDTQGQPLLPEKFRTPEFAENIAQITSSSMSLGLQGQAASAVRYLKRPGFRGHENPSRRLNTANIEEEAWQIDFVDGFPFYKASTSSEMLAWREEHLQASGFLGVDWGDVWNSIKNGFDAIVDGLRSIKVWIDKAANKIRVTFELLIDGAVKLWDTVIDYAQQAFDFVEGVWNYLKVKLQQLYEWLAFFFNLEDIKRTAEAVEHTTNVLLDFTIEAVDHVRTAIADGIDYLKEELESAVDSFLTLLDGNPTMASFGDQYKQPDGRVDYASDHNLMLNATMENIGSGSSIALQARSVPEGVEELVKRMEALADNFEFGDGKEAFNEALDYFSNVGGDVDRSMTFLISGIVKLFESLALFALDFAKGILISLMDLVREVVKGFRDLVNEEIEIPIISQVWEFFTGETVTFRMIGLTSYIIAIPGTLLYKAAYNEAPFTEKSLREFKEQFTADWLMQQAGLKPKSKPVQMSRATADALPALFRVLYSVTVFARIFTDIAQALKHAKKEPSRPLNAGCVALRFVTTGFSTPWALNPDAGGFACPAGAKGFSNVVWLLQIFLGPIRGAFMWWFKAPPQAAEVTLSLWGVAHVIMDSVNYAEQEESARRPKDLAGKLTLNIPGQALRFLAITPQPYNIPVGVLSVLIVVGYGSSIVLSPLQAEPTGALPAMVPA
jgi:hypothetical protein